MRSLNVTKAMVILLSGLLFACSGVPSTPDAEVPREGVDEPTARWLIWGDFEDGISTYEIEVKGQQSKVVATYPKIRIATSTGVWEWSFDEIDNIEADCQCFAEAEMDGRRELKEGECQVDKKLQRGRFYEIDSDRSWVPDMFEHMLEDGYDDAEYNWQKYEVTGSLGTKAFVTTCVNIYYCGAAHSSTSCGSTIIDLETLEIQHPSEFVESLEDTSELDFESEDANPETNGAELVEFTVRATPDGATLDHRYVTETCYACSDGDWSSYTASAVVEAQPVEGVLESDAASEPALQAFIEDIGPNRVKGWSKLGAQ